MLLHPASDVVHPNRILKQVNGLLPGNGSFAEQNSNLRHYPPRPRLPLNHSRSLTANPHEPKIP